jgi:hypothetical protein
MVGVVKGTRFYPEPARRLFIFKAVNGKARPLWLGSKLGGRLEDFRFRNGRIRALETTADSLWVVSDYRWSGFGMAFERFIVKGVDKKTATKYFSLSRSYYLWLAWRLWRSRAAKNKEWWRRQCRYRPSTWSR